jgi:UrcA family protein
MRHRFNPILTLAAAAAVCLPALPAFAQTEVDELVVYGNLGPDGEPETLSRSVSYADLDLIYKSDRDELRARIRATARDLCRELGESPGVGGLSPTCEQQAYRDAMKQAEFAFDEAPNRHYAMLMRERAYDEAALGETYVAP